jgi:hypothetical protein
VVLTGAGNFFQKRDEAKIAKESKQAKIDNDFGSKL